MSLESRWPAMRALATMLVTNFAIALILTLLFVWMRGSFSWDQVRLVIVPNWILSNAIGFSCAIVLPRLVPAVWNLHPVPRWAAIVAGLLALTFAGVVGSVALLVVIHGAPAPAFWPNVWSIYRVAAIITLIIGIGVTLYHHWRYRIEAANLELKNKEIERERALKLAASAQLASIESRIHPHFLFNALNSISSLIREDPARAEEMVGRLAHLLRSSLDTQQESLIPLDDELKLVRDYLEIQRARFGERLRYRLECAAHSGAEVPPFAVQTLVENSIKHAIALSPSGGEVVIRIAETNGLLRVEVQDDGPGFDRSKIAPGRGLDTLRARLEALFGPAGTLDVPAAAHGALVRFTLPARAGERTEA
ncbi:MAG: histidine kinase [Bryobacteraceae bacterium]